MIGKSLSYACALFVCFGATLPVAATPLPDEPDHVLSLNGIWRFRMEQIAPFGKRNDPPLVPAHPIPFQTLDYKEGDAWHDIPVPSNWEMLGYSVATYYDPDNSIGLYRLEFVIPAAWQGREVYLDFDGVQEGAEVFLNGQPVDVHESSWGRKNYHEGGFNPFQVDLTPQVKVGQKNLLAVRVNKNSKSQDLDSGDFFYLGGIYRNVRLFSLPKAHVSDLAIRTTLQPNDKAQVEAIVGIEGNAKATVTLEGQPPVEADATHPAIIPVDHPRLWSAEKPNLYDLSVDLKDDSGKVIEHLHRRVGIREVSIQDGVLMVNHVPVKLTGMCRHEEWATLGSALGPEQWRKDITLMKANNVNAIRTSHYPYGSGFYDLCDELGVYVMDEMAACWCLTNTNDLTPAFAQHAREYVQRDKNHPCVIVWAVGNENQPGKNTKLAAEEIRKIDPTRPRLVSNIDADKSGVEIDDAHYPTIAAIAKAEQQPRRQKYPKMLMENPNVWDVRNGADFGCDDLWGVVMDRYMKEIWKDRHVPGTFLWEWQDRGVADKCPTKERTFYPETGIQILKVKGLVDAWRNPRPALYSVKMAYSPVQLDREPHIAGGKVTLHARNFYSFTNFSELKATASLLSGGNELAHDAVHFDLAPMSEGDLQLTLPVDALAKADVLRLEFTAADGRNVVTQDFRLKPEPDTTPAHSSDPGAIKFPRLNFTTTDYATNFGWQYAHRHPGKLIDVTITDKTGASKKLDDTALYATPLVDVRSLDAEVEMDVVPENPGAGRYMVKQASLKSAAPQNVAHVHVEVTADGHFTYKVTWHYAAKHGDVQELGWAFAMPKACDHFAWHRQGYWSYYPPDQIGRPAGTATPDSADQQLTKLTRVDAFDFNSTKYRCDWATLADKAGRDGLLIRCDRDDRQHCRANVDKDAGYSLIVNQQCSPPHDISSPEVKEFFLELQNGQSAGGAFTVAALRH